MTREQLKEALNMAYLCAASYATQPATSPYLAKAGFSFLDTYVANDFQAVLGSRGDDRVVAFRGTNDLRNVVTDISAGMTEDLLGWVHKGVQKAVNILMQAGDWYDFKQTPGTLFLTGHSLGGAMAMLSASRQQAIGTPGKVEVYTFAQPRVGDVEFAKAFKLPVYRFVAEDDIVPTLPPQDLPGTLIPPRFYRHVGPEQFLDGQSAHIFQTNQFLNEGALKRLSVTCDVDPEFARAQSIAYVDNHRLDGYIAKLEALQNA